MAWARADTRLVIAVDDTDCPEEGGTGRVAREIARRLAERFPVRGVSRHQFAVLPEIRYTRRNSGNAVHVGAVPDDLGALADEVASWVDEMALPGSEPGICVARAESVRDHHLGREAQRRVVTREEARAAAHAAAALLRHPRAGASGIIGAFAAACLAAGGNDGRFVETGRLRALSGPVGVQEVLDAGGDMVLTVEGEPVTEGLILADRLRPALRMGKRVVYCARREDGLWVPLVGGPGDQAEGEGHRGGK